MTDSLASQDSTVSLHKEPTYRAELRNKMTSLEREEQDLLSARSEITKEISDAYKKS